MSRAPFERLLTPHNDALLPRAASIETVHYSCFSSSSHSPNSDTNIIIPYLPLPLPSTPRTASTITHLDTQLADAYPPTPSPHSQLHPRTTLNHVAFVPKIPRIQNPAVCCTNNMAPIAPGISFPRHVPHTAVASSTIAGMRATGWSPTAESSPSDLQY